MKILIFSGKKNIGSLGKEILVTRKEGDLIFMGFNLGNIFNDKGFFRDFFTISDENYVI